jgi:hypothetical protein
MAYTPFGINYDTSAKISAYGGDAETPAQPIWAEDTNQLWIVHGTGGKYRVAMASELANYLTTATASATYLSKTDAGVTYLGINAKAKSASTADAVAWTGVSGKPQLIPGTGDAGTITTTETVVAATTVSDTSARSMKLASGGTLTVNNGSSGKAWITVVALEGSATINFSASWAWSGSAPTLGKGLVTLAWYGSFGVATFTKYGS